MQYGLIAEDVGQVFPDLVVKDGDGNIEAIRYQEFTPMLLNELQKLARSLEQKQATIDSQQRRIDELRARLTEVDALEVRISVLEKVATEATVHQVANNVQ